MSTEDVCDHGCKGCRGAKTDAEVLARLGTDGAAWSAEFAKRLAVGLNIEALGLGWFANAIEAGRSAGYAQAKREDNPNWPLEPPAEEETGDMVRRIADEYQDAVKAKAMATKESEPNLRKLAEAVEAHNAAVGEALDEEERHDLVGDFPQRVVRQSPDPYGPYGRQSGMWPDPYPGQDRHL